MSQLNITSIKNKRGDFGPTLIGLSTVTGNLNVTGTISGDGSGLTGIANTANIKSDTITVTGVVTATTFDGDLSGTATNATNAQVDNEASADATRYIVFADAGNSQNRRLKVDGGLNFNPSTNTLTVTNITGTASNAGTLDSLDSTQFLRSDAADTKTSGDLTFNDSIKANFGTGNDLEIFHNGSNAKIINGTGRIDIETGTGNIDLLGKDGTEAMAKFIPDGAVELYYDNSKKLETTTSGIEVSGDVNSTSDINLKKDIEVVTSATEMLNELRGVRFIWKENGEPSLGVIAQEVEAILPELVKGEEGDKSVNYSGLIGVLIESVKELSARVEELENR